MIKVPIKARSIATAEELFSPKPALPNPVRPITSVAFVTADRPSELGRAIVSYTENFAAHGRQVQLAIFDDSKSHISMDSCLSTARNCIKNYRVRYAGGREKRLYIRHLARAGIAPEIARFALLGERDGNLCTAGANRNAALLDTVGEHILCADDDTICRLVAHPERNQELKLQCGGNPREMWFASNREGLFHDAKWGQYDLLREHESILGYTVSELAARFPAGCVQVDGKCRALHYSLADGSGSVAVTMSGVVGDSGSYAATWLLSSHGATRRRFLGDEVTFRCALQSREVLGVVRSLSVTHSAFCMGTSLAMANRDTLPPFFPIGRNEDGVFGILLKSVSRNAFVGHIPIAIAHDPAEARHYQPFPMFRVSDLIICLIYAFSINTPSGLREALGYLGNEFLQLSRSPDRDFWEFVSRAVTSRREKRLTRLENCLSNFPYPPYLASEILKYRNHLMVQRMQPDWCVPVEFRGSVPPDVAKQKTKKLVRQTGALLCLWTAMLDAAQHLRASEIRVSTILSPE